MTANRAKKATLSDVAERAGVSRTTASYILGKTRGGFAKETVERVSNAAKELGFTPNPIAQGLRTGRTGLLGLLVTSDPRSPQSYIRSQIEVGISIEARKRNMDLIQFAASPDPGSEIGRVSELVGTGLVEGLVLHAPRRVPVLNWLRDYGATFVVVGDPDMHGVYSVDVDNVGVGRSAAKHLIDFGHKKLLYVAPPEDLTYGCDRVEGFLLACAEASLPTDQATVIRTEDSMAGGYSAVRKALKSGLDFTGICASDDSIAYGAVTALKEVGLSVPEDVSVVGCNDDYLAGIDQEFLTTIELDFVKLGSLAARKLITLVDEEPTPRRELVDFRLLQRKSSGPASACGRSARPGEVDNGGTAFRI